MRQKRLADIPFVRAPFKFLGHRFSRLMGRIFNPHIPDIIIRTLQAAEYVLAEQSAKQADVVIHPNLIGINWWELSKADELIKAGEEAARQHLAEIKQLLVHH